MCKNPDLIIFDPILITRLLHLNMTNNYFVYRVYLPVNWRHSYGSFFPDIANIFMSSFLNNFFLTVNEHPLFMRRYIDNIVILWPKHHNLDNFFFKLNNYHSHINFTLNQSSTSIDFLNLTIYNGYRFNATRRLDFKIYQKDITYQYIHFTSNHPKSILKGVTIGEAIRYICTSSSKKIQQTNQVYSPVTRKSLPPHFINRTQKVSYSNRAEYLETVNKPNQKILTDQYSNSFQCQIFTTYKKNHSQWIHHYNLQRYTPQPLFVTLTSNTIKDIIVNSSQYPSAEDTLKIKETTNTEKHGNHNLTLPHLRP